MLEIPSVRLPHDVQLPVIGLGTAGLLGASGYASVRDALDAGYRMIDTATSYRNEAEVGRAVRDSGLDRSAVFVTTKLPPEEAGRESAVLDASLSALGLDYVDLWLIHWPPGGAAAVPTWQALLAARESGKARAVGVSNYSLAQVDELIAATGAVPAVNQVPWSPRRHDPETLAASRERDVVVMGYGPLRRTDLADPTLAAVAEAHGVSPAQVVLRWHLHHDVVVIPRSADPDHRRANLAASTFALTPDEIAAIDAISR
ncbi:MAG: aldo/keto reductase [Actinophytocola sp.]|uniref:aldo/keto reductase n=1 Tax=Actinophytocola sp. TaxID=1872138 RepID=UPI003D6A4E91